MKKYLLIVYLLFTLCVHINAQQVGLPYHELYTEKIISKNLKMYSPQNWTTIQDKRGIMYFANTSGVLVYDGVTWQMVDGSENISVYGLIYFRDIVYVAGNNEIGCLTSDKSGKLVYTSLLDKINPEKKNFGRIWQVCATDSSIYFNTFFNIIKWTPYASDSVDAGYFTIIEPDGNQTFWPIASVDNKVYVYEDDYRLNQLTNDSLVFIASFDKIKGESIYAILPFKNNSLLLSTFKKGNYVFNGRELSYLSTSLDTLFRNNFIYSGIRISDNQCVLGTQFGGYCIIDSIGNVLQNINKENILSDNTIINVFKDNQGGIWNTGNMGDIGRAELLSPLSYFDDKMGLDGIITFLVRFKDILYAGTFNGLFYFDKNANTFVKDTTIALPVFSYYKSKESILFCGSDIYQLTDTTQSVIEEGAKVVIPVNEDLSELITIGTFGINKYKEKNGKYIHQKKLYEPSLEDISNIIKDRKGNYWFGSDNNLARLEFTDNDFLETKITYFDSTNGLPPSIAYYLADINNKLIIATDKGIFEYEEAANRFVLEKEFGYLISELKISTIVQDAKGNIWLATDKWVGKLYKDDLGKYQLDYTFSLRMHNKSVWSIYAEDDGVVWIGTTKGLIRYDTKLRKDYFTPYYALIRKVNIDKDSTIFWGNYCDENGKITHLQPKAQKPILSYNYNSISFDFSAPFFDDEKAITFSHYLEGYDKEWSKYSSDTRKEYTNLAEGQYTFRIKAKNIYEHESIESIYSFKILPPWYRTFWAYIFYGIAFIFFVWILVVLNTQRLRAANIRLQKIVDERTAEIRKQRDTIEEQKQVLTDSIEYAQNIQRAMLPSKEEIGKYLPNHFVYFQPKQIVSGDFYWFYATDTHLFIAAVDCTGHGVPGAFVSVMGNNLLNQIIVENKETNPGKILTLLNQATIKAFKKESSISKAEDGMDMVLCVIHKSENRLQYAGAQNSLLMVTDNDLQDLKADKTSIGGRTIPSFEFITYNVEYKKGDMFYMYSDGYIDQFGGKKNKKFRSKYFKQMLSEIAHQPFEEQKQFLHKTLLEWQGENDRVDDVLVIGFSLLNTLDT